ncbi:MAG: 50S ribosomal protein L24 [Candidatus Cloacimonetes bacterium]|nr:50S ribosomal protein L24 [Candidatus Cloacimonadota bacterium]
MKNKLRLRKGDNVIVITGKYKGVKGRILKVFPKDERVIVENVNFIKRHSKPRSQTQQGGIIEKEAPIHVSNVMLFNTTHNMVSKPVIKIINGNRIRVCKKTGDELV